MEPAAKSISINGKSLLPTVIIGAITAPILIILISLMQADPTMREMPILIIVAIMGAAGGATVGMLKPLQKEGSQKTLFIAISIITYLVDVALGFVIGRLGPF